MKNFQNLRGEGSFARAPRGKVCGASFSHAAVHAQNAQGASHKMLPTSKLLIGSRPLLEMKLNGSPQRRKYFLTGGFLALFSFSCLVKPFVLHSPPSLRRRNPSFSTDAPSAEPEYPRQPWFLDRRAQVV
jgi:hypothetical protein